MSIDSNRAMDPGRTETIEWHPIWTQNEKRMRERIRHKKNANAWPPESCICYAAFSCVVCLRRVAGAAIFSFRFAIFCCILFRFFRFKREKEKKNTIPCLSPVNWEFVPIRNQFKNEIYFGTYGLFYGLVTHIWPHLSTYAWTLVRPPTHTISTINWVQEAIRMWLLRLFHYFIVSVDAIVFRYEWQNRYGTADGIIDDENEHRIKRAQHIIAFSISLLRRLSHFICKFCEQTVDAAPAQLNRETISRSNCIAVTRARTPTNMSHTTQ